MMMMHLNLDLKLGITQQPRIMIVLCNFFAKHFTIVRVKAQLDQMIDGLKLLIYDLIKANHAVCTSCLQNLHQLH